jgi:hypothetical protein
MEAKSSQGKVYEMPSNFEFHRILGLHEEEDHWRSPTPPPKEQLLVTEAQGKWFPVKKVI